MIEVLISEVVIKRRITGKLHLDCNILGQGVSNLIMRLFMVRLSLIT